MPRLQGLHVYSKESGHSRTPGPAEPSKNRGSSEGQPASAGDIATDVPEPTNEELGIDPVSWRASVAITVGGSVLMLAILWGAGELLLWAFR